LSCGTGIVANNGVCEIECTSSGSGRRIEEAAVDSPVDDELDKDEYVVALPKDNNQTFAADVISGYLAKHPDLASRLGPMDGDLLEHLEKLGQLFGQPAFV
jgi:ABC-type sugar transport system substrate-binding protein